LGEGTNNWEELNSLWMLMRLAIQKEALQIQTIGDSKLVTDWIDVECNLQNLILCPIFEKIKELKGSFSKFIFNIYIENSLCQLDLARVVVGWSVTLHTTPRFYSCK
jgi:hypothetical protein